MAFEIDVNTQLVARFDLYLGAQPVQCQFFQQGIAGRARHIQQQCAVAFGDKKVEQDFALRRQQGCVQSGAWSEAAGDVIGHQALQEIARLRPGNGQDGAVIQKSGFHPFQLGGRAAVAKGGRLG